MPCNIGTISALLVPSVPVYGNIEDQNAISQQSRNVGFMKSVWKAITIQDFVVINMIQKWYGKVAELALEVASQNEFTSYILRAKQ